MELNEENVETVLDEVRPYLMAGEASHGSELPNLLPGFPYSDETCCFDVA